MTDEKLINTENYNLVEDFLRYKHEQKGLKKNSVDRYRFYLQHSLYWAMDRSFTKANNIKPHFAKYVKDLKLSEESKKKIIETFRDFLRWCKFYNDKKFSKLPAFWIDDLTPPEVARKINKDYVSLDHALAIATYKIDKTNLALWRDQAMAALLYLSGARAGAATTLPIKAVHLDTTSPKLDQHIEFGVKTKNNKSASTFLLIIPQLMEVVIGWDTFVRQYCPPDYPWYAPIQQNWGDQKLSNKPPGKDRGTGLNKRLRTLAELSGLPHKSPHKYRHGHAVYALKQCSNVAQYHAVSRNLMHASIAITDGIYAYIEEEERGRLIAQLSKDSTKTNSEFDDDLRKILLKIDKDNLVNAIITVAAQLADS